MWVLVWFALNSDPAVLQTFPLEADCTAALATVRLVENETKAPFSHFCLPQAAWEQYLVIRKSQEFEVWRQNPEG